MTRRDFILGGSSAVVASAVARPIRSSLGGRVVGERLPEGPYDAEVEYLESTGTQYIDLNVNSTADSFCNFEIIFQNTTSNITAPFGYRYGATARYGMWAQGSFTDIYVGADSSHSINFPNDSEKHHVALENGISISFDGQSYPIGLGTVRADIGAILFGLVTSVRKATSFQLTRTKVHRFALLNVLGEEIRDMIPVRKDGVGYMFDFVSESLFGNAGTGTFVIGPDV